VKSSLIREIRGKNGIATVSIFRSRLIDWCHPACLITPKFGIHHSAFLKASIEYMSEK
jgi:hypothetical protein